MPWKDRTHCVHTARNSRCAPACSRGSRSVSAPSRRPRTILNAPRRADGCANLHPWASRTETDTAVRGSPWLLAPRTSVPRPNSIATRLNKGRAPRQAFEMSCGYLKVQQKSLEHARRDAGIRSAHRLVRMMADAAMAATHEQHADVGEARDHHGVVTGAARQAQRGAADGALDAGC